MSNQSPRPILTWSRNPTQTSRAHFVERCAGFIRHFTRQASHILALPRKDRT
jgi:hypothetical protein